MAYTVNQSTTGVQGAADDLIYVVEDSPLSGTINYRYVCVVLLGAVEVIKLKQLPNNQNAAVFNIQSIAKNYVYQDDNPYSLGVTGLDGTPATTKIFATNENAIKTFTVRFGYEYSATAEDSPAETLFPLEDVEVICINGNLLLPVEVSPDSSVATSYKLTSANKRFLSDIEPAWVKGSNVWNTSILYDTGKLQRAALSFLNGDDVGSTGSNYVHVSYFNGSTALNTAYFTNTTTQGGKAPAASLTDGQSLLYVGVGTYNLENQAISSVLKPTDVGNTNWTHYYVQMSSGVTLAGATSVAYKFERVSCGKYIQDDQVYSLHWWNSKGGVDNLPLLGKVKESQDMSRQTYRTSGGNSLEADGTTYPYAKYSWEGGKRGTRVQTTTSYELSTIGGDVDSLTPLIRSLMNSERVFLSGASLFGGNAARLGSGLVQCVVKDSKVEYLSGVNDQSMSYKLNIEVSRRRANP